MISGLMPLILKRTTSDGNQLVFNMSDAKGNLIEDKDFPM